MWTRALCVSAMLLCSALASAQGDSGTAKSFTPALVSRRQFPAQAP